jgi:hypothetical protein
MAAVLPEDLLEEIPQGFTQAGHIGKLNCLVYYVAVLTD